MTVCVGLIVGGVVYIATDDRLVYDEHVEQADGRKVVTRTVRARSGGRVPLLATAAGYVGLSEALRHDDGIYPPVPAGTGPTLDRWADTVAARWAERARARRCTDKKGDVDGNALLAIRGRLYDLGDTCGTPVTRLTAIGSGSAYAYGAIHALGTLLDTDPVATLIAAVEAACAFDRGCSGPVVMARLTARRAERLHLPPVLTGATVSTTRRGSDPAAARRSVSDGSRLRPAASSTRR